MNFDDKNVVPKTGYAWMVEITTKPKQQYMFLGMYTNEAAARKAVALALELFPLYNTEVEIKRIAQ